MYTPLPNDQASYFFVCSSLLSLLLDLLCVWLPHTLLARTPCRTHTTHNPQPGTLASAWIKDFSNATVQVDYIGVDTLLSHPHLNNSVALLEQLANFGILTVSDLGDATDAKVRPVGHCYAEVVGGAPLWEEFMGIRWCAGGEGGGMPLVEVESPSGLGDERRVEGPWEV